MSNVKSIHFDSTGVRKDFVKVVYKNDRVSLLDTTERGDVEAVLKDLENGDFDECIIWSVDSDRDEVVAWPGEHPNAVLVYGE